MHWQQLRVAAPGALSADSLDDIRERGTLRIGVAEFHPWTYSSPDGELEGFEIDVGRRVAQAMGVDPEFRMYVWDEIIDGLEANEIDMIAPGMAITPLRAERVDFSDAYSESGFTAVANKDAVPEAVGSVKDIDRESFVVALVEATLSGQAAPLFFDRAELTSFTNPRDAEAAVLSGNADAYVTSVPEANLLVAEHPDQLALALAEPLPGAPAGFAVQPGNDSLLDFLNEWIAGDDVEQWLETTYDGWFTGAGQGPDSDR